MNDEDFQIEDEHRALSARLAVLRQEHADIDAAIEALGHMPIPDQFAIARMKRRKLALRDEIVKIEAVILPDIIA